MNSAWLKPFKQAIALIIDDLLSLFIAAACSLVSAAFLSRVVLPFWWWPVWSFGDWMVVLLTVYTPSRLWHSFRRAAL